MPIDLYWDDDNQSVMLAEFKGKWTWDELQAMLRTIKRLSIERNQIFGAIVDVREGLNIPGGSIFNREALAQFNQMLKMNDGGKGPVVILGMNAMVRTIFETVDKMNKSVTSDVYFAQTMDDARSIIYRVTDEYNRTNTA